MPKKPANPRVCAPGATVSIERRNTSERTSMQNAACTAGRLVLRSLSIPELAQIFAEGGKATHWTDLGVEVPGCKRQRIMLFGRHNTSGSHNFFRRRVFGTGSYKSDVHNLFLPEEVVDHVAKNPCAIGYDGSHTYAHQHVKMVCVSKDRGGSCVKPNVETIVDKSYPISRPLYMYTNDKPNVGIQAYLDWILSAEGQCIAFKEGFAPVLSGACL